MIDLIKDLLSHSGVTFVIGGICGFLATRLTMSASERSEARQRIYENGVRHKQSKEERYTEFTNAMRSYVNKPDAPTLNDFHSIASAGDLYFNELKLISDAILSKNIDKQSRDNTFAPSIEEALEKDIPLYYETLNNISKKLGATYDGEFKTSNYESMYRVVERFGKNK